MTLIQEFAPVLFLLLAALLLFGGTRMARHFGSPEALGCGVALCIIAIAIGLSPATWRAAWAGGAWGDRLLTYARLVGLAGLLFLAGTTFRVKGIRTREVVSFGILGVFLFTAITLLLKSFNQPTGTAVLIAAVVVSSSLWFPAQVRMFEYEHETIRSAIKLSGVATLTVVAMLGVYFADVLGAIPSVRRSVSAHLIVTLYELVKLAVLFGFAFFISTRFLSRAEGRISPIRANIAFVLLSILFFALISLTLGQLGAMAWAFFAGALWRQTEIGDEVSKRPKPLASALLLSFVFLTLPLQSHGRQFTSVPTVLLILLVAIALKVFLAWLASQREVGRKHIATLAATAFPGELAIVFLSFSVTKWAIDGPVFFTVLGIAFLSSLLIPILTHAANHIAVDVSAARRPVMKSGLRKIFYITFCVAIIPLSSATTPAQQPSSQPAVQEVQLGSGMSVITPGLMEIGSRTKLFLVFADKVPLTVDQQRKLEGLFFEVQMFSVQREADLDVADAELKRLLTRDTIDLGAVRAKMREIESIRLETDMKRIETLLRAIGVLSHEQHMKIILIARDLESTAKPREPVYQ